MRVKIAVDVAKVLARARCRVFLQSDTLLLNLHEPIARPVSNHGGSMLNGAAARIAEAGAAPAKWAVRLEKENDNNRQKQK